MGFVKRKHFSPTRRLINRVQTSFNQVKLGQKRRKSLGKLTVSSWAGDVLRYERPVAGSPATSVIWTWQAEMRYRSVITEDFGITTFGIGSGVQFERGPEMHQIISLITSRYETINTYKRGRWISNLHRKIPIRKMIGLLTSPKENFDVFPNIPQSNIRKLS